MNAARTEPIARATGTLECALDNFASFVDVLVKDAIAGVPHKERIVEIGDTPSYLATHAGYEELRLAITGSVISKAFFDHGIHINLLKRLPSIIASPKALFRSASSSDATVVLTFEQKGSWPVVIPIGKDRKHGRNDVYNMVLSVYGKEGADPGAKWKREGLLLWEA